MKWLINREDLSTYGVEHINSLINHFETLFSVEERDKILNEFPSFKIIMNSLKTFEVYELIATLWQTALQGLKPLSNK